MERLRRKGREKCNSTAFCSVDRMPAGTTQFSRIKKKKMRQTNKKIKREAPKTELYELLIRPNS